jgi:hypothetical protein
MAWDGKSVQKRREVRMQSANVPHQAKCIWRRNYPIGNRSFMSKGGRDNLQLVVDQGVRVGHCGVSEK